MIRMIKFWNGQAEVQKFTIRRSVELFEEAYGEVMF